MQRVGSVSGKPGSRLLSYHSKSPHFIEHNLDAYLYADILVATTGLIGFNGESANMRFAHTFMLSSAGSSFVLRADIFRAYKAPEPAFNGFQFGAVETNVAGTTANGVPVADMALPDVSAVLAAASQNQASDVDAVAEPPAPEAVPEPQQAQEQVQEVNQVEEPEPEPVQAPAPAPVAAAAPAPVEAAAPAAAVGNTSWAAIAGKKGAAAPVANNSSTSPKRRARRTANSKATANGSAAPPTASTAAPAAAAAAEGKGKPKPSKDGKAPAKTEGGRQRTSPSARRARAPAAGSVRVVGELATVAPEQVRSAFAKFGPVASLSEGTLQKGFCFVDFETLAAVQAAAAAGTTTVAGVQVTVEVNSKFDASRQRPSKSGGRRAGSGGSRQPRQRAPASNGKDQ